MSLPDNLRRLRKLRYWSQRDLARASGLAPLTIGRLEAGLTQPEPRTVRKLADALGVEPIEIASPEELTDRTVRRPDAAREALNPPRTKRAGREQKS